MSSLIIIKFHEGFARTCACDIPFFFSVNDVFLEKILTPLHKDNIIT